MVCGSEGTGREDRQLLDQRLTPNCIECSNLPVLALACDLVFLPDNFWFIAVVLFPPSVRRPSTLQEHLRQRVLDNGVDTSF
jgi:hypothetical protein